MKKLFTIIIALISLGSISQNGYKKITNSSLGYGATMNSSNYAKATEQILTSGATIETADAKVSIGHGKKMKIEGVVVGTEGTATNYTIDELRNLKDVKENEYHTKDAVWIVDRLDKKSEDNTGTVLVTVKSVRLKRQYTGAVQSDWFKTITDRSTIEVFNYLFNEFDDICINAGVYNIDVVPGKNKNIVISGKNKTIKFEDGAIIKVNPSLLGTYEDKVDVINIGYGTENLILDGLTIQGDKHKRPSKVKGEFFSGLTLGDVKNSVIRNLTITEMWGDGMSFSNDRIGKNWSSAKRPENITLENFLIDDNGRNGITMLSGLNCVIQNGKVSRTNRTAPQAGIDFEQGVGSQLYAPWKKLGIDKIIVRNVDISDNAESGIVLFSHTGEVLIDNCNIHSNKSYGITSRNNNGTQTVRNTKSDGILFHNMWNGNKFIIENSNVGYLRMQENIGGIIEVKDKSYIGKTEILNLESGSIKIEDSGIKILRIMNTNGTVLIDKSKIDAKNWSGFYGVSLKGLLSDVTIQNSEITGANKYGSTYGLIVDENAKISSPENVKIINNHFYGNSKNTKIAIPIIFKNNQETKSKK